MTTAAPAPPTAAGAGDARARWPALIVLCLGDLMIVLDGTIVNVALPSIRDDLGFDETSRPWVANAYPQQILGYTPLEVGLVHLPSMVVWGGASIISDRIVMRFGILRPLVFGLGMMAVGGAVRPHAGSRQHPVGLIPGALAIGLGAGSAAAQAAA